jgi:hypothetical protein
LAAVWPSLLQERFSVPEILTEVFLGNEYGGELVENFNHVVERKRATGFILRRIPGKSKN